MSEIELPNPKELKERREEKFSKNVALITAIYAVILAITSLGGSHATKEMLLTQMHASDTWSHFQAKSIRAHESKVQGMVVDGLASSLNKQTELSELKKQLKEDENKYQEDKKELEDKAAEFEAERNLYLKKDPFFEFSEVLLQISVVLASIAILASSTPVFFISLGSAVIGTFLSLNGFFLFF